MRNLHKLCIVCGNQFSVSFSKCIKRNIRPIHSITCSKNCSKLHARRHNYNNSVMYRYKKKFAKRGKWKIKK